MLLPAQSTLIGDLKFRAQRPPHPRALSAASRVLESAELHPPELPPSAILIVRRIDDPLPQALQSGRMRASRQWEQAVRQRLSKLLASADRPRWAAPSADCEAVLFADEAEMLACLAMDLAGGTFAGAWWWRLVARRLPAPLSVEQVLASQPRLIPAIMTELHGAGRAAAVLQSMSAGTAQRVAVTMLSAFEVSGAFTGAVLQAASLREPQSTPISRPSPSGHSALTEAVPSWTDSPLHRYLPEYRATPGAPLIHAILTGAALGLHREPARLRSPLFGTRVLEWVTASRPAPAPSATRPPSPIQLEQPERMVDRHAPSAAPVTPAAVEPSPIAAASRPSEQHIPDASPAHTPAPGPSTATVDAPTQSAPTERAVPIAQQEPKPSPSQASETVTPQPPVPRTWPDEAIRTSFGGVFFLIHLMDRLNIPEPSPFGDEISRWAWLELIARGLLERAGLFADDPIWAALRDLDGRMEALPAEPSSWRPHTLTTIAAWLVRELAAQDLAEAVQMLLIFPAKVNITRVSIDVVASLNDTRVSVRRAGLDLDPGWQPDFGRIVQFHYE